MAGESSKQDPTWPHGTDPVPLPRVAIKFCVQCKWNLRAAYYAQELLQTFSLSLGEIALIPSTSGTFVITLLQLQQELPTTTALAAVGNEAAGGAKAREHVIWDRKTDGGFPETKELKRRVRDLVEPGRGLGHVDREYPKVGGEEEEEKMKRGEEGKGDSGVGGVVEGSTVTPPDGEQCNDCA